MSSYQTCPLRGSKSLQPGDFPHASWYEVTLFFYSKLWLHTKIGRTACLSQIPVSYAQKVINAGLAARWNVHPSRPN